MPKTRTAWLRIACCAGIACTLALATTSCSASSGAASGSPSAPTHATTAATSAPWADPDAEDPDADVSTPPDIPDVTDRDTIPGEGRFLVGTEIQPGEYVSADNTVDGACTWKRLASDKGGTYSTIIAKGQNHTANIMVVIDPQDGAFESTDCMDWKLVHD